MNQIQVKEYKNKRLQRFIIKIIFSINIIFILSIDFGWFLVIIFKPKVVINSIRSKVNIDTN